MEPKIEEFLTLREAEKRLAVGGKKPSIPTFWRWCRKGCRGVFLKYSRFGREIPITAADLVELVAHLPRQTNRRPQGSRDFTGPKRGVPLNAPVTSKPPRKDCGTQA